jgi:hypothetical protein
MGNRDRRDAREDGNSSACVVCGASDKRQLSFTRLMDGERVTVCGSHKTAHHRSATIAKSVEELRQLTGERRRLTG